MICNPVCAALPAQYMALYSASKHAVEGISETLNQEVCQFGIRAALVEPSFTKTNQDLNTPRTMSNIPDYSQQFGVIAHSIQKNVQKAHDAKGIASTIVDATHLQGGCIAFGQVALLHACRPRREEPEKYVWAGLMGQSVPSDSGIHSMDLAPRDQLPPMSGVAP